MRKRNTPRPVRIGVVEIIGTGAMGMAETDTIDTKKIGAKNMAETGAMGAQEKWLWTSLCLLQLLAPQKSLQSKEQICKVKGRPH